MGDEKKFMVYPVGSSMAESIESAKEALLDYNYLCSGKSSLPPVYLMDEKLVTLEKKDGEYCARQVDSGKLSIILTTCGKWDTKSGNPPKNVLDAVLSAGSSYLGNDESLNGGIDTLKGLRTGALLRKDWSLVTAAGYDGLSGYFLTENYQVEGIPDPLTKEDVDKVMDMLWDIFKEFNFADRNGKESVDYQNTIAALVSAAIRPIWEGALPVFAVTKSSERTGGTLLQEVVGILATGARQNKYVYPSKFEEYEKGVDSIIAGGRPFALIDNVLEGHDWVADTVLSQSTGCGLTSIRRFGRKSLDNYPPSTFISVNGINLLKRADITGRLIPVSIVPEKSWQELRYNRTKEELLELALEKHPEVLRGIVLIRKYWEDAGSPAPKECLGNISEYPLWYHDIVGMLYLAGMHHILDNLGEVQTTNNEAEDETSGLLEGLYGYAKSEVFSASKATTWILNEAKNRKTDPEWEGEILPYLPESLVRAAGSGNLAVRNVGIFLTSKKDRKIIGCPYRLRKVAGGRQHNQYYMENVESQQTFGERCKGTE